MLQQRNCQLARGEERQRGSRASIGMERLVLQVQATQKLLQDPETDWRKCCSSIEELATAVESLGPRKDYKDVVRLLLGLSREISLQISALRPKMVKDVCEHLRRILLVTGRDFEDMANVLLPDIVGTSKNSSAAIRQPGAQLLCKLSEKVRYDLVLLKRIYMLAVQEKTRALILEQLRIVFVYWSDNEVLPWVSDVLEIVRQGLNDQQINVRKEARDVLCRFSSRWSGRVDELLKMLSDQAKALLIDEHRESPLAAAIMERHPEFVAKSNKVSLVKSRSGFRSLSRHKSDRNIEIHVSATPPLQQQEDLEQKLSNSGETMMTSRTTSAAPEGTESNAVARHLLNNPDFSYGSDVCQQDKNPTVSSRLQLHGRYAKKEMAQPDGSEVGDIPGPQDDIHSQMTVAGASIACIGKEKLLQHSRIRQFEDSQISSLPNLPCVSHGEKHLESPTRFSSSLELESSVLSHQGSFLLKGQENIGPFTPVGSAHVEEDKAEPNPLIASHQLISSSIGIATSLQLSTENVMLRPRRQTLAHQGQDSSPPRPSSSVLSVPKESIQPRLDTAAVPVAFSSQSNQEAVSSLRKQYALNREDNDGQLTGKSDHAELNIDRDHRRLDDSRSQSERESRSVKNDDDEQKSREREILLDERYFDEQPRHRRNSLNGVDNFISGNAVDVVDDDEMAAANELEVSETDWRAKSSLQGHCPMQNETEEKGYREEEQSTEVEPRSLPNDALTGLQNVRNEMMRLRATTDNEDIHGSVFFRKHNTPMQDVFDTADVAEKAQEQFLLEQNTQSWKEAERTGQLLETLTHADQLSRKPLIAPSIDIAYEQPKESSRCASLLKTPEQGSCQATKNDDGNGRTEESTCRGLQPPRSPLRVFEHSIASISERTETLSLHLQKDIQPQESFDTPEQSGRFDAAEKLFAAKKAPCTQGLYNRPQSPEPERYMHSEPHQARCPPTQLGAKLNPSFVRANNTVVAEEKIDAVRKDVATEDVTTVEGHKEVSLENRQPVDSLDETSEMLASDCVKRDTIPLTSDTPPARLGWASSFAITIVVFLAATFCMVGIHRAAKKVQDSHEYHLALKTRIDKFEASITEIHKKVLKLEDDYVIWSEYVRKLTEEDEVHALSQLETIQAEVRKWQRDMNADLVAFQQALSTDSIEASLAELQVNNTSKFGQ